MAAVETMRLQEGAPLKTLLAQAERQRKTKAVGLVLPLFAFIVLGFALPILLLLYNAIYDPDIRDNLPLTIEALDAWNGGDLPDESAYAALVTDLKTAQQKKTTALIGKRLNYEISGIRSKIISTGRKAEELESGPYKQALIEINAIWGERNTWAVIKRSGSAYTLQYLLSALDLEQDIDGDVVSVSTGRAIYGQVFLRTMTISAIVTLLTLALGYPLAYLLVSLPQRTSSLLMILVLLPFWTSILVRTTAWFVLLQDNGPINNALLWLGVTDEPLKLIFSRFGTIIAMTHIQLPFTLLPIYSVMKNIPPSYVRAARSLGAGPVTSFLRVYLPQTIPGVAAGCLVTFILCLGYYITPALVGGPSDQMVSGFIAEAINKENNWGKASALGAILLSATLLLFLLYNRLVGVDKMKLG